MRKINVYKLSIAWLFIAMLIFPYIGKTVHVHECTHSETEENPEHERPYHDCRECQLCSFAFFSFTPPEETCFVAVCFTIISNQSTYIEKGYHQLSFSFYRRGPLFRLTSY